MLVADINIQGVQETAEKSKQHATHPKYRALSVMVDVTDPASVQEMVDAAVKEFGRIDYSVNSAGVSDIPTQSPSVQGIVIHQYIHKIFPTYIRD